VTVGKLRNFVRWNWRTYPLYQRQITPGERTATRFVLSLQGMETWKVSSCVGLSRWRWVEAWLGWRHFREPNLWYDLQRPTQDPAWRESGLSGCGARRRDEQHRSAGSIPPPRKNGGVMEMYCTDADVCHAERRHLDRNAWASVPRSPRMSRIQTESVASDCLSLCLSVSLCCRCDK
jgi:hypothetical protein